MSSSLLPPLTMLTSKEEPLSWHKAEKSSTLYLNPARLTEALIRWSIGLNEPFSATKEIDSGKDSPLCNNLISSIPQMHPEAIITSLCQWTLAGPEPRIKGTGDKDGDPKDKETLDGTDHNNHIREELLKLVADLKGNSRTTCPLETVSAAATRATSPETVP
jgi:hypothetical protein